MCWKQDSNCFTIFMEALGEGNLFIDICLENNYKKPTAVAFLYRTITTTTKAHNSQVAAVCLQQWFWFFITELCKPKLIFKNIYHCQQNNTSHTSKLINIIYAFQKKNKFQMIQAHTVGDVLCVLPTSFISESKLANSCSCIIS